MEERELVKQSRQQPDISELLQLLQKNKPSFLQGNIPSHRLPEATIRLKKQVKTALAVCRHMNNIHILPTHTSFLLCCLDLLPSLGAGDNCVRAATSKSACLTLPDSNTQGRGESNSKQFIFWTKTLTVVQTALQFSNCLTRRLSIILDIVTSHRNEELHTKWTWRSTTLVW